ncbi:MAG TPA: MBL fold metallo-hydrolase [Candidatus Binataceae bacterium]|nr:MBL fold metallo-hydrolase [Candidatus Binataceae bacterium]
MEVPAKIKIGEFEIALLSDGLWRNDGGCMFGVVPRELWQRDHPGDDRNRIRLNLTCPLIMRGTTAVVVDTGIGNRLSSVERRIFDHGEGWLPDGLKALGMEPGDVTHVVLSHLHFDHCGGLVRRRSSGVLEAAFPRAKVMVQRGELEIARASRNERLRAAYRHIEECLAPLQNALEPLGGDTELMPGLDIRVTGGHTLDHQVVQVRGDDGGCFVHLADIVPTRSHMKGPWNQAYDLDALRTMEVKADYLARAVAGGWWVSFAHDDRVLAARVRNDRGRLALGESISMPSLEREQE